MYAKTPRSNDVARSIRIGLAGGGAVAVLLGLTLFVFSLLLGDSFDPDRLYPDAVRPLLLLALFALPVIALAALPVTGHVTAAGAVGRPLRAGGIAAGTVAALVLVAAFVLRFLPTGFDGPVEELLSGLLRSAVPAAVAAGLVVLGAAGGARERRHVVR
jgi:hypothetical protein